MPVLVVTRSSEYANRFRKMDLRVDGIHYCTISNGEQVRLDLDPGIHSVVAKIDWASSKTYSITLRDCEEAQLRLSGYKGSVISDWALVVFLMIQFGPERIAGFDMWWPAMAIGLGGLAHLIYLLSFGSNKYLQLKPAS